MYDEYLRHIRARPIDHRLTVPTLCGDEVPNFLTREKAGPSVGCISCLQKAEAPVTTGQKE